MTGEAKRVLLVEDSRTQAERTIALLTGEGFAVDHAASAEEALPLLSSRRPDLLIVDYNLPGMQGDDLCRRVRLDSALATLPILILTASDEIAAEGKGLDSGADDYLPKSLAPETLALRIRSLLRRGDRLNGDAGGRARPRALRCLVVDDSPTQRTLTAATLESDGYEVAEAATAAEALAALERETFDCVIGDLVMPGMDGIELTRRIDEWRRRRDVFLPIIILTARERADAMAATLDAGADDFLVKSGDLAPLKARLRVLLRRKAQADEASRIAGAFRRKDEALRAAEERAALARELEETNRELAEANRRLKETQSRLVQSAKMASLGELVAGIAHEINNPLAFVLAHLDTVKRRIAEAAAAFGAGDAAGVSAHLAKAGGRIDDMHEGLDRVRDLVTKLRTFSRLDEGAFKTVDIHESLDSTLRILAHRIDGRIELKRNYCNRGDLSCFAGEINQVFMNVLSNAADAVGSNDGTIVISTERNDTEFRIRIADSGKGIPPALRQRVFEPFFTTKEVGKGTGLGLSISYAIVRRHGGTIEIGDGPEGQGATVDISLPVRDRPSADATIAAGGNVASVGN